MDDLYAAMDYLQDVVGRPKDGIPVAIEMFQGNTGDPATVAAQVTKVKDRFGIGRLVLVGDRDTLTAARLREDVAPAGLDWITALRAPQVEALVRDGDLQLSLFDVIDLAEITSPNFPGERLVACMNPYLEAERACKRESLLTATEADLGKVAATKQTPGDLGTICLNTIAPASPRCPASASSPPPPRSSGRPSTARRQPPPWGSRSPQPGPVHHESPSERPHARITEGNFGLVAGTMTRRC